MKSNVTQDTNEGCIPVKASSFVFSVKLASSPEMHRPDT